MLFASTTSRCSRHVLGTCRCRNHYLRGVFTRDLIGLLPIDWCVYAAGYKVQVRFARTSPHYLFWCHTVMICTPSPLLVAAGPRFALPLRFCFVPSAVRRASTRCASALPFAALLTARVSFAILLPPPTVSTRTDSLCAWLCFAMSGQAVPAQPHAAARAPFAL
jgi:hypothetical protein